MGRSSIQTQTCQAQGLYDTPPKKVHMEATWALMERTVWPPHSGPKPGATSLPSLEPPQTLSWWKGDNALSGL